MNGRARFCGPGGANVPTGRWSWGVLACVAFSMGCAQERASPEDCATIFDRIVELELREMGYADPELLRRKQQALRMHHRRELDSCVGKAIPSRALSCAAKAKSTEELSHECMR